MKILKRRVLIGVGAVTMLALSACANTGGSTSTPAKTSSAPAIKPVPPHMTSSFIQPNPSTTIYWTSQRFLQEYQSMKNVGINSIIDQWTVDIDANEAYYPSSASWYPQKSNMVGNIIASAGVNGVQVWLGLGNVYNWQSHASDTAWLNNQAYIDEITADQLYQLYGNQFKGWYISNEVNDKLLSTPADVAPMTSFFQQVSNYLHTHDGNKPVMTSPTYANLTESPTQFAASCVQVMGTVDVLNVQDSGGSGYEHPADITNWFTALHNQLAGTHTALWDDPDMFSPTGGPMNSTQLQNDLKATTGLVNSDSGFSFTTQMGPSDIGTSTYYDAYKAYFMGN